MSKEQEALNELKNYQVYQLTAKYNDTGYYQLLYKEDCYYKENVDTLEKVVEDLSIYKKAFEMATDNEGRTYTMVCSARNKTKYIRDYFLNQSRKELKK